MCLTKHTSTNPASLPRYLTGGAGLPLGSYSRCMDPPRSGFELELLRFERIISTLDDHARCPWSLVIISSAQDVSIPI